MWTEKTMLSENGEVIKIDNTGRRQRIKNGANLAPRAHVPFGQHQDTELWNNQGARSQSPRIFCF